MKVENARPTQKTCLQRIEGKRAHFGIRPFSRRPPLRAVLFGLVFIANAAVGQWLETTILLPDTLLGLAGPTHVAWESAGNTIYAAGGPGTAVIAVDASSGRKIARIPLWPDQPNYVRTICLDFDRRELYCFSEDGQVRIIDCRRNVVVDSFGLPYSSYGDAAACYNPRTGKLYYAMDDDGIAVVDCAQHRIVDTIPVSGAARVACSPRSNFIYCSTAIPPADSLFVINGAADTIDTVIPASSWIRLLYYSAGRDRLYCYGQTARSLTVFDCATNRLLATVPLHSGEEFNACADSAGKLFAIVVDESLFIVDGESHEVRARLSSGMMCWDVCYSESSGRFCACETNDYWPHWVVIVDGASGTIVGQVAAGWFPSALVSAGTHVYCGTASALAKIDPATCSLLDTILTDAQPRRVCWEAGAELLYCVSGSSMFPFTAVVDPARCELVRWAWHLFAPEALAAPGNGRLYGLISGDGCMHLVGYDARADTALTVIRAGIAPLWLGVAGLATNEEGTRAYCAGIDGVDGTYYLATADLENKRHLAQARLGVADAGFGPIWNPVADKVYLAGVVGIPQLLITDGTTGSLIGTIRLPAAGPLCCDRVRNRVFCFGSTLSVVDGASDSVLAQWSLSDAPAADAACDPSLGRVYAVVREQIFICGSPSGQPLDTVILPTQGVTELVCDTVAGKVYCLDPGSRVVHVVDGREGRMIVSIQVGQDPMNMAWVPTSRRAFVLNRGNSRLSVIRDTTVGVAEAPGPQAPDYPAPQTTFIRGVLCLPEVSGVGRAATCALHDVSGRTVTALHAGTNDLRHLGPGVYFVREKGVESREKPAVRKVVIAR